MAKTKNEVKTIKPVDLKTDIPNRVLVRPLISEKGALLATDNKYQFEVGSKATKATVRKAVEMIYGIKPVAVNIINTEDKNIRFRGRPGVRYGFKKAIITLPKGMTINVYEGV